MGRQLEPMGTFIFTASGKQFDLLQPDPEMVSLVDIADGLARIPRYNGQTVPRGDYGRWIESVSVAEHAYRMSLMFKDPRMQMLALHHDDHEAYHGDMTGPIIGILNEWTDYKLQKLFDDTQNVIYAALEIDPPTDEEHELIKDADFTIRMVEMAKFMHPDTDHYWRKFPEHSFGHLWEDGEPLSAVLARDAWFSMHDKLSRSV